MSKHSSISAMIALSAFIAAPVLAQSMSAPANPAPAGAAPGSAATAPAMNSPALAPSSTAPMTTTMGTSNQDTYKTADNQVRASKLIGSSVYNDQKQKIGSVSELLMNDNHAVTSAVLSVGGFLGIDSKLVKIPYDQLHIAGDTIVMPGASKDQLKSMPDYSYKGAS